MRIGCEGPKHRTAIGLLQNHQAMKVRAADTNLSRYAC